MTSKSYFKILTHTFNTWDEVREYINRLVNICKCKILPNVVQYTRYSNGDIIKGWSWTPFVNNNGEVRFR